MTIIGETSVAVRSDTTKFRSETSAGVEKTAGESSNSITKHLGGIAAAIGGAFAIEKVTDFFAEGIKGAATWDAAEAQVANTIKTTGGAAGVTTEEVAKYAKTMQDKTGVDKASIIAGENMLLTFTNVRNEAGKGNDIFTQSSSVLGDLAKFMGTDSKSAAIQLGKALNDPTKGLTALTRVGVTFDQGQKDSIKSMQASGNTMGAQKIILGELNKEFGGTAETAGKTAAGQFAIFKTRIADVGETVGAAVLPALVALGGFLSKELPPTIDFLSKTFDEVSGGIKDLISGLTKGTDDVGTAQTKFAVFGAVVAGIFYNDLVPAFNVAKEVFGVVVAFLREHSDQIKQFFTDAWATISAVVEFAVTYIRTIIETDIAIITFIWQNFGSQIMAFVETAFNYIWGTIENAMTVIRAVISLVMDLIHGDWGKVWGDIKTIFGAVWDQIKLILSTALQIIGEVLSAAWQAIKLGAAAAWDAIWGAIKSALATAWGWLSALPGQLGQLAVDSWNLFKDATVRTAEAIWSFMRDLPGRVIREIGNLAGTLGGKAHDLIQGFVNAEISGAENIWSFFRGLPGKVLGALGDLGSTLLSAGGNIISGLVRGIESGAGAVVNAVKKVVGGIPVIGSTILKMFSPSRVMMEQGVNVMRGMAIGIDNEGPNVSRTLAKHMTNLTNITASGNLGAAANGGSNSSSSVVTNNYINGVNPNNAQSLVSALQREELLRVRRS